MLERQSSPAASPGNEPSVERMWLVLFHLFSVYLAVPLPLGAGVYFPVAALLITTPLLLALNWSRLPTASTGWWIVLVASAALTLFFAPRPGEFFFARLNGLVLWTFSTLSAYALIVELVHWPRERIARVMLYFSVAILIGCLLEVFGGLRPISDAFRSVAFPAGEARWRDRDLEIAGFERPKLFTSEPSDVAKFFTLATFVWVALSRWPGRHPVGALLCVAGTALTRSPIVILLLPLQALLLALGQPLMKGPRLLSRPLVAAVVVVLAIGATGAGALLLAARISQAASGEDASSLIRIVAPVAIAAETLVASPWWGAGISGTESVEEAIVAGYELAGIASLVDGAAEASDVVLANQVNNAFWLHWINLGLLGGLIALAALRQFMLSLGARRTLLAFAAVFVFANTMGAAHAPYFWAYVAMCIVVAAHLDALGPLLRVYPVANAPDAEPPRRAAGAAWTPGRRPSGRGGALLGEAEDRLEVPALRRAVRELGIHDAVAVSLQELDDLGGRTSVPPQQAVGEFGEDDRPERRERSRCASQHPVFRTLGIDLQEAGFQPMLRHQGIDGACGHAHGLEALAPDGVVVEGPEAGILLHAGNRVERQFTRLVRRDSLEDHGLGVDAVAREIAPKATERVPRRLQRQDARPRSKGPGDQHRVEAHVRAHVDRVAIGIQMAQGDLRQLRFVHPVHGDPSEEMRPDVDGEYALELGHPQHRILFEMPLKVLDDPFALRTPPTEYLPSHQDGRMEEKAGERVPRQAALDAAEAHRMLCCPRFSGGARGVAPAGRERSGGCLNRPLGHDR